MRIEFDETEEQLGPTLGELIERNESRPDSEPLPREFIYEGYVYAIIRNNSAKDFNIQVADNKIAVINLKSLTVRALHPYARVQPVVVKVKVAAAPTEKFKR